ncbi:MAG: undecaprenyl-diphosphate phosphatase [Eubacterium sp.]|nr:undecaprenyl-diphosphate phosphatase [Eubacterium sp.]
MPIWKAALLGVIQGITSVLPVSSSGHIALFGRLLGESSTVSLSFMVYLHIGTLLAILWSFQRDAGRLVRAYFQILMDLITNGTQVFRVLSGHKKVKWQRVDNGNYRKLAMLILTASLIEVGVSLIIRNFSFLGASNLLITAMGFFVTALLLFISSYTVAVKNNPMRSNYRDAVLAGVLQGAAGIPGVSRLGMALSAGSLSGMEDGYMVRFAFLMGIPGIIGSLILILPSGQNQSDMIPGAGACVVGILMAAIVSALLLKVIKRLLTRNANRFFALYTVVAGIMCIVLYFR